MTITIDYRGDDPNFLITALRSESGFDEQAFGVDEIRIVNRDTGVVTEFFPTDPVLAPDGELLSLSLSGAAVSDADGLVARIELDPVRPFLTTFGAIEAYIFGDITPLQNVFGDRIVYDGASARGPIRMDAALFSGASGPIELTGTRFDDLLVGTLGNDRIVTGAGVDVVLATRGNDTVDFRADDETMRSGSEGAVLDYSQLDDASVGGGLTMALNLGTGIGRMATAGGTDALQGVDRAASSDGEGLTVIGTGRADSFRFDGAGGTRVVIAGGGGDDRIDLRPLGNAQEVRLVYASDGVDDARSGIVANFATGVVAEDGFGGRDRVQIGGAASSLQLEIRGTAFGDRVIGTDQNDVFLMEGGGDTLDGGAGRDAVIYSGAQATGGVTVSLMTGNARGSWDGIDFADRLIRIEEVVGTRFRDEIVGNDTDNLLIGGGGRDALRGAGGADTLQGGDGQDFLEGGGGADLMEGGAGDDSYRVDQAGDRVVESADGGFDRVFTTLDVNLSQLANIEELVLRGDDGLRIEGGRFSETRVVGDTGDDLFVMRGGSDTLEGGAGDDVFAFLLREELATRVVDFGGGDRLALDDRFFGLGDDAVDVRQVTADQVQSALRSGKAVYDRETGALYYDTDGADGPGTPDLIATLDGAPGLAAEDLLLF